ncbi:COBRA-like protein-7 precursor [Actinidia rufa]|uniref:COBRA-like protein-7 n=1 Tax=Actinidia rufa TaxID=165716 RepID=A0A7J0GST5_9ERIC|nr:COBRA-like protein-7 precursor [Actinidia rufa]
MANFHHTLSIFLFALTISLPISLSQPPPNATCNGIFVSYAYTTGYPIAPNLLPADPTHQPYRFESTLTVLNNGLEELKSWQVFVGFRHREFLVSASDAVLADGTSLPADVSNGTVFAGSSLPDLKSAAQTAGDVNRMRARVGLVGTQFGVGVPNVPLPASLYLVNDGFSCPPMTKLGTNELHLCCIKAASNSPNTPLNKPRKTGDVTIMYDVIKSDDTNYWAQVTISNYNPIGRLDNWHLSWDWMRDEFIHSMRGAYPYIIDTSDCIFGRQGQYYQGMDFSTALNCERAPIIIDLPLTKANDTNLGLVPFCCRNGTILPPEMDHTKSKSAFLMQVFKNAPGREPNPDHPASELEDKRHVQSGLPMWATGEGRPEPVPRTPVAFLRRLQRLPAGRWFATPRGPSWRNRKCCVSFSAFFNDSVVPCNTCACGCKNYVNDTCSAAEPALLLPSEALLVPFENRTKYMKDWAKVKKMALPNPSPCGDNCGVSINWHVDSDYKSGWKARITLFNWGETDFADWFAAVQLDRAMPGFEEVYSFNGSVIPGANNTMFLQGLPGLNYLVAEKDGSNPRKNPPIPGTQQSDILFTKKTTPGIDVARGDGFPTKVYFNGEECSMPSVIPSSGRRKIGAATAFCSVLVALLVLLCLQQ